LGQFGPRIVRRRCPTLAGDAQIIFHADLLNVLNNGVVLERNNSLNTPQENFVTETLSPRIWRLGLRVNWR
jgi:hypothetical protein